MSKSAVRLEAAAAPDLFQSDLAHLALLADAG
ncbi:hypothetical protein CGMCC3_g14699 [Colletotrichum fructicola]|nr:uncharacterized protein CGMCC3_g14699 [Colletotrichum fructicola]KAE9569157.1 hypothetical protein CGMCC3_g14699 [Colletotrichum fructicola]